MNLGRIPGLIFAFGLFAGAPLALGQESGSAEGYSADTLTFERWCVEIQQYERDRCARKDASDVQAYHYSLDRLQSLEVEHDKEVRKEREFRKTFEAHTDLDRNRRFDF